MLSTKEKEVYARGTPLSEMHHARAYAHSKTEQISNILSTATNLNTKTEQYLRKSLKYWEKEERYYTKKLSMYHSTRRKAIEKYLKG